MDHDPVHEALPWGSIPTRTGYYLERTGVPSPNTSALEYRGIDRLLHTPEPLSWNPLIWSSEPALNRAYAEYFARYDDFSLFSSRSTCIDLSHAFNEYGINCEVIAARLMYIGRFAILPEHEDALSSCNKCVHSPLEHMPQYLDSQSQDLEWLGFDISTTAPHFHSALFQLTYSRLATKIKIVLNANGLIPDRASARTVADMANKLTPVSTPFCVLDIYEAK